MRWWWPIGSIAIVALASLAYAANEAPLARLENDPAPGWDGLRLGMSLVALERRIGTTLALDPATGQPVCSRFAAEADYQGYRLLLGFAAAKPSAKLESLWIQFGGEVALSPASLATALKRRLPEARYAGAPESEADDPLPVYELPGKEASAVRLSPRDGMLLARRGCLDALPAPR